MSRQDDIKKLLTEHQRHLQLLKEQQVSFGLYTPTHILSRIQDREAEIETLQAELAELEPGEEPPPHQSSPPHQRYQPPSPRLLNPIPN